MIPAVLTHCVGIDIGKRALADPRPAESRARPKWLEPDH